MSGTRKYVFGAVLAFGGTLVLVAGIWLTSTVIGACIGVPLAVVGFALIIWGLVWAWQGYAQRHEKTIAEGTRKGVREALRESGGSGKPVDPTPDQPAARGD